MRVAFLGTPSAAVPVLRALAGSREVAAVFCNPDRPQGRGRHLEAPPVKHAALDLGLAVHQPLSWKDPATREAWEALGIDLAVVVAYGHILPRWMLDGCRLGAWNLHFSLLPRWRGAAPVNHALLAGDAETGVGLMRISPGLDEGPVLAQTRRPITLTDTADSLLEALAQDAAALLLEHLPALEAGRAEPRPQDGAGATVASKLHKGMAPLDPARPALDLHRQVRGLHPWPGAELPFRDTTLKVCAVGGLRPDGAPPGTLAWGREGAWLTAGDGRALELTLLQRPGKPVQPAAQALQPWGAAGSEPTRRRA
ncbi:methionyl-tRNA formyltransferase [Mesoterricola silvestris]|uniref:Methionyl-tRNA formyltransferase n=1 Tax=Mesoterricola silvestris TaxID=2927979 RepID=A0AA48K9W4_9BACT|nr:methionyl-tRNA formyltransferase [Mesoterricola silvestris]BDU74404.1 methionyl-tRNA formyltransferase [Mesoterricola silvestris]